MPISEAYRNQTFNTWDNLPLGYCDPPVKRTAHRQAKRVLTDFALHRLGLKANQFEVRSNMGGIAVSGEVTLHTEAFGTKDLGISIQVSQSCLGPGHSVLWRTVKGRKDYTGGQNMWGTVETKLGSELALRLFAVAVKAAVNIPIVD